jgi:corrinoid protein of di/trimethylamine methyltransferase
MTSKQRILKAARGDLPDLLPYVPRLDLWYNANSRAHTLPERHRGRGADEICRAEGWALHKVIPDFANQPGPDAMLHRALGIYTLKEQVFRFSFSPKINLRVKREADRTIVEYHTPKGMVRTIAVYNEEMKKSGVSVPWISEHAIKKREDYAAVASLFENLGLAPCYEEFRCHQGEVGEDGVLASYFTGCSSPVHHIQKHLLDPTDFYFHYNDHQKEMRRLAESMEPFYDQALKLTAESPAEMSHWGGNFDEMVTYAPYFERDLMPWIRKASDELGGHGKLVVCHCDGENQGLMDLIRESGMHIAEAVCPAPMTKVSIAEYYRRWSDKLTLFGGIPSILLLQESTPEEEFGAYLDDLFHAVAPGKRMILGIADSTPPQAIFQRLVRIGEKVEREGRLPLEAGAFRPLTKAAMAEVARRVSPEVTWDRPLRQIQDDVLKGDHLTIQVHIRDLLDQGVRAEEILRRGMLTAMEVISERFKNGEVFIPEVLLSARAMNDAALVLEPYLAGTQAVAKGKVLIGTVKGDLHDIGKNLVVTLLKGVGFETVDLGVDVPAEEFVRKVAEHKPDILGLSALLTTTMPQMKKIIDALRATGLRDKVKVMVGGAPVNEKFAHDIGSDGYAHDAGEAVKLAKQLLRGT